MSTYYFMACEDHKVRTDDVIIVSRVTKDHLDNQEQFCKFLMHHRNCNLRLFSEGDDERYNYPEYEEGSK